MSSALLTNGHTEHIPAWKKLGLKLKSAQNELEQLNGSVSSTVKKRKRTLSDSNQDEAANGQGRIGTEARKRVSSQDDHTRFQAFSLPVESNAPQVSPPPSGSTVTKPKTARKRTKSVSFTADTKERDGESIKHLFQAWVQEEKAKDPSFRPDTVSAALKVSTTRSVPDKTEQGQPRQKKEKRKRRKLALVLVKRHPTERRRTILIFIQPCVIYSITLKTGSIGNSAK